MFDGNVILNHSLRHILQIYRCYIVWSRRSVFILFPLTVYTASLGECFLLLVFNSLIDLLQLPVLVFLSQWVKPTMGRWCSLNHSVVGFQVFSRSLLQPVPPVPVSHCSSNWVRDWSHTSNDRFENLVSEWPEQALWFTYEQSPSHCPRCHWIWSYLFKHADRSSHSLWPEILVPIYYHWCCELPFFIPTLQHAKGRLTSYPQLL